MRQTRLLGSGHWSELADRAAALLPASDSSVIAVSASLDGRADEPFLKTLLPAVRARTAAANVLAAPRSNVVAWRKRRAREWISVDLKGRGDRLGQATMPRVLFESGLVVVVNDLTSFDPKRPAIAIGVWAQLAHPRQRFGASLSDPADGLAAEIALAAPPAWFLIAASWHGLPMLVIADDMIAAELVGLAIGQAQADPDRELAGPWEHPLVQRAAELVLGVRIPSEIDFETEWLGPDDALRADFMRFGAAIAARIGISTGG